jgi:hypothetical protein
MLLPFEEPRFIGLGVGAEDFDSGEHLGHLCLSFATFACFGSSRWEPRRKGKQGSFGSFASDLWMVTWTQSKVNSGVTR